MKRIFRDLDFVLAILFVAALSLGCPAKETPGPTPEPTAVAVPTENPDGGTGGAVCYTPGPPGAPPYCADKDGNQVTCPSDVRQLPTCP